MALLAYDFMLTSGDEVRLIWGSKWNSIKVLFFATRYPVFIDGPLYLAMHFIPNLDPSLCNTFFATTSWILHIGVSTAGIIMLIKTYALYGCNRSIGIVFVTIFMGVNIPAIIFVNRSLKSLKFLTPSPLPTLAPCIVISSDRVTFLNFVFLIILQLAVVILSIWKGVYQWRENRGRLINTLVKDGVVYFLCLFAISTANAIVLVAAPSSDAVPACIACHTLRTSYSPHSRRY
ncbi:hypothetical protein BD410DRAFT_458109 [Rickenella mellea]|uniref:DUF6533 domain-containing protein n=1 Tax=Rickenella mellea TaxID=50990 RepID=A0A4Y7PVJ8_9AGAM|nr:hypothetical protein BD410DRAFT_458109 [Rickenella mellea]